MIQAQRDKVVVLTNQGVTAASNATTGYTVDSVQDNIKYERFEFILVENAYDQTNATKLDVLKATRGSSTAISNHSDISGLVGTTNTTAGTSEFSIVSHSDTSVAGVQRLGGNFAGDRYAGLVIDAPNATHDEFTVICRLSQGNDASDSRYYGE